jgi:tight adherence protein C
VVIGLPCAAALGPDLVLARLGHRRRRAIAAALPGTLELMAVRARTGGGPRVLLRNARGAIAAGPLRDELAGAWAEMDCGVPAARALERLGREGGPDLATLAVSIERARRLGAPLAAGLQKQAEALRTERGRQITDEAARAAPKIQLVVALLLVPSVLLLVGAAIAANADLLLSGLG